MSSLRDRLRNIQQGTAEPLKEEQPEAKTDSPKKSAKKSEEVQPPVEQQQPVKQKASDRIVKQVESIAEDLDIDKLQELNNGISGFIFNLVMYPINLIDRLILVLRCNKQRCALFNKTVYIFMAVIAVFILLEVIVFKEYFIGIGGVIGIALFWIIERSIRK